MVLKAVFELIRFLLLHLFSLPVVSAKRESKVPKIWVTLTTTPNRIKNIKPTLRSLIHQSVSPDMIILNVPKLYRNSDPYIIPDFLLNMPKLKINRIEYDLGPATKLLPTLKKAEIDKDDLIIVVDDDQVYPYQLLENYLKASKMDSESSFTLCGWQVPATGKHKDRRTKRGAGVRVFDPYPTIEENEPIEILQGASSYLVKSRFLDLEVFNYQNAPREAFFVDDIWFSGHLSRLKVKKFVLKTAMPYMRLTSLFNDARHSLVNTQNSADQNNDSIYRWFDQYWKLRN